jgi:Tol biopolymer transport system component
VSVRRALPVGLVGFAALALAGSGAPAAELDEPGVERHAPSALAAAPSKGLKKVVVLGPPERNAGKTPVFAWKPVRGASTYQLVVLAPDGPLWAWQGEQTKVRLGGLPGKPPPGLSGPILVAGSCWSVAALDDAGHVVAASDLRRASPNGAKVRCGVKPAAPKSVTPGEVSGNAQILFYSERDGNREVYVMADDGSELTKLAEDPADDSDPVWSPDRKQIVFDSRRTDDNKDIYVMKPDGSEIRRLTTDESLDSYADWSPDGKKIAFTTTRHGLREIYVMDADGSHQTNLTKEPDSDDAYPSWSPDGRKIAFETYRDGNTEIYVMNADGSRQRNITNNPADDSTAAWSPDGTKISFESDRDGNNEVYVLAADGSRPDRLNNEHASDITAACSPDGTRLVFSSKRDGNFEVYVMQSDGSDPTRLTNEPADDFASDWAG